MTTAYNNITSVSLQKTGAEWGGGGRNVRMRGNALERERDGGRGGGEYASMRHQT